jgi:hypothetical protein
VSVGSGELIQLTGGVSGSEVRGERRGGVGEYEGIDAEAVRALEV